MMLESAILVIVGWVLGVVTTLIERRFHREERKSDRRRELCERDLNIVRDSVDVIEEAMGGVVWGDREELLADLLREAFLMQVKALLVAISLEDEELRKSYDELSDGYGRWLSLIDRETGKPKEGKEEECREAAQQTHRAAAEVVRRRREILEEV